MKHFRIANGIINHERFRKVSFSSIGGINNDKGDATPGDDQEEKTFVPFSVDRTGLLGQLGEDEDPTLGDGLVMEGKEEPTELAKDLSSYIKMKGPITVHDYMAQAANHSLYGYYQHKLEKIGTGGDFITAPEISQLFGEMVGIWCVSVWMSLGKPKKVNLVEMGPGKGTLMKDILKVVNRFPAFNDAVQVNMVELSATMRGLQYKALVNPDRDSDKDKDTNTNTQKGGESTSAEESKAGQTKVDMQNLTSKAEAFYLDREGPEGEAMSGVTTDGVHVQWHNFLQQVVD